MTPEIAKTVARSWAYSEGKVNAEPKYLPRTEEEAKQFEPHTWVIRAIQGAFKAGKDRGRQELFDELRQLIKDKE